ncbi:MAG: rhamnulokinase [Clostridiales bacterium]|nr:rhamnulokinase [Clostridiales bacterium]
MRQLNLLAFDIGASNGRGIMGCFDGRRMTMRPVGSFDNHFSQRGDLATWDYQGILDNLKAVFAQARDLGLTPDCYGIDTWGVDYGLLDKDGRLLENPRAYRMSRDEEMHAAWQLLPRRAFFDITGVAALNFNTSYQLYRRVLEDDPALKRARALLFMPDLLGHGLSGALGSEYTIATTSGLLDVRQRAWSRQIIEALDLPGGIFQPLDLPGSLRGRLSQPVAEELGLPRVPQAVVGGHDTASAVAAIPGTGDFAFCSSGTWSLFGVESEQPLLSDAVFDSNFSNEGTVQGGFRPLRNIMGLWLAQECRRAWAKESGKTLDWEDIKDQAAQAPPLVSVLDPDYPAFYTAGGMPQKIRAYCRRTGQPEPETVGQFARCIYESLALKYRWAVERLGEIRGRPVTSLNITGGGIQNLLLNQMAADSTGLPVTVGPVEGAALGNALMQAMALGEIRDINQARQVVRDSVETQDYTPRRTAAWDEAYATLLRNMEELAND